MSQLLRTGNSFEQFQRAFSFFISKNYHIELQKRKSILNAEPPSALRLFVMHRYVSVLLIV